MDTKSYGLVFQYVVFAFIGSAIVSLKVLGRDLPPYGSSLLTLGWAFVGVSTVAGGLSGILVLKLRELRSLQLFKNFTDGTFPRNIRREAVMKN